MILRLMIAMVSLFALAAQGQAGPFGLTFGAEVSTLSTDGHGQKFTFLTVPNPHPSFQTYSGWGTDTLGLCRVLAFSDEFKDDAYGTNVQDTFGKLRDAISKKYGAAKKIETMQPKGLWDEPRDWVMSLLKNERIHAAIWKNATDGTERHNLIHIWILASRSDRTTIALEYRAENFDDCVKEIEEGQNSSF